MADQRPQGRQKNVVQGSASANRRGSGLGTGPVGSGVSSGGQARQNSPIQGGSVNRASSGGRSPLLLIVIAAVVLLGGGGGLLSGLFGGGGAAQEPVQTYATSYATYATQAAQATDKPGMSSDLLAQLMGISPSAYSNISGASNASWANTSSGSAATASSTSYDKTVADGTRQKYTSIVGGGADQITIMVYMCGADLESKSGMATRDITEMTKATLGDNINLILYTGGAKTWKNSVISASNNQIYQVVQGGLKRLADNAGNGAMTDPNTLVSFIQFCKENYPANRYDLIFWDHGSGSVQGYGYDEKNSRAGSMDLAEIQGALKKGGLQYDFVGFDACLMATVETALMLDPYADYLIASEETEPGIGWYYTDWLTKLSNNPSMSTLEIGKNIADDFVRTCASSCPGQSATLSVTDIGEVANTIPSKLTDFSKSIIRLIDEDSYKQVSQARSNTREFATSAKIDQIDLAHFAINLGNAESTALSETIQKAVKYNRTSTNMTNCYGLSVYFPYQRATKVDTAVNTYKAIGMDSSYSECIRSFASLQVSGQAASGGTSSPLSSLMGTASPSAGISISDLLGSFLGGGYGSVSGLSGSNTGFLSGRSAADQLEYIEANYFDGSNLSWTTDSTGRQVLVLPTDQWELVNGLAMNMFVDDGEGFIDLGLDNLYAFDDAGNLVPETDNTWLSIDGNLVAYYYEGTVGEGTAACITGYVPVMLNDERAELILVFDESNPAGYIAGARTVYDGETETVAKTLTELEPGDKIDFLCDYYNYDGSYSDSYYLGEAYTVPEDLSSVVIGNIYVDNDTSVAYRITDIYNQHYWTDPIG